MSMNKTTANKKQNNNCVVVLVLLFFFWLFLNEHIEQQGNNKSVKTSHIKYECGNISEMDTCKQHSSHDNLCKVGINSTAKHIYDNEAVSDKLHILWLLVAIRVTTMVILVACVTRNNNYDQLLFNEPPTNQQTRNCHINTLITKTLDCHTEATLKRLTPDRF